MSDLEVLRSHGIEGSDAETALRVFQEKGGLLGAYSALTAHFGSDAVRVALVLIKESR